MSITIAPVSISHNIYKSSNGFIIKSCEEGWSVKPALSWGDAPKYFPTFGDAMAFINPCSICKGEAAGESIIDVKWETLCDNHNQVICDEINFGIEE